MNLDIEIQLVNKQINSIEEKIDKLFIEDIHYSSKIQSLLNDKASLLAKLKTLQKQQCLSGKIF